MMDRYWTSAVPADVKTERVPVQLQTETEPRFVDVVNFDGLLLFEGDIAIRAWSSPSLTTEAVVITGASFRWPNKVIPFVIESGLTTVIGDAMAHWEEKTRIRFRDRETTDADYLVLRASPNGSDSEVGRRGGAQVLHVFNGATVGEVIHEIGHAVGLWHEHSRSDRDDFVSIDFSNIQFPFEINFNQHITDGDDVGAYDYGSIMHYAHNEFAIDRTRSTIIPKQAGVTIGQRAALSSGDIAAVAAIYP